MITIYTTPNCKHCNKLKKSLNEYNIDYTTVNLREPGNQLIKYKMKACGFKTIPIIEIGDKIYENMDFNTLLALI